MMSERPTPDDVQSVYRLLLGREPDPGGLAHWTGRLGELTLDDLVWEFLQSIEFRQRQAERLGRTMDFHTPATPPPSLSSLACQMATQGQMDSVVHWRWCEELAEPPLYHRKQWEFVYALQVLDQAGMLAAGRRGLGFGVGREPVPSILAKRGCDIVVTDLDSSAAADKGWRDTHQHSNSVDELHRPDICNLDVFRRHVRFRVQDMNAISDDLKTGSFDFVWSLCALDHLGSLANGLRFIKESLACLKPGGIAVHTTEYNVTSNDDTVAEGGTVLYRRRDIECLADELAREGYQLQLNFHPGDGPLDRYYDVPPYRSNVHLKLQMDRYVATSLGLMVRKPGARG